MNITLDDTSPLFQYRSNSWNPGWTTNHTDDPSWGDYFGGTYYATYTDGDTATLTFNGSAVYVYGGKRFNHGMYSAQLDGGLVTTSSGLLAHDLLQQLLFSAGGLSDSEHTLVMTVLPLAPPGNATNPTWFDIDYAVITAHTTGQIYTTIYDDTNPAFKYRDSGWTDATPSIEPTEYYNMTAHLTQRLQDSFDFSFNGTSVQMFGGLYLDHGNYSVSIDGSSAEIYNGTYFEIAPQTTLFHANNLTDGPHTITFTNIGGTAGNFLDFDYAVVNSTINPKASTSSGAISTSTASSGSNASGSTSNNASSDGSSSNGNSNGGNSSNATGAIAGGVVGGIIGLALVVVLAWFLFRRNKQHEKDDYEYGTNNGTNRRMDLTGEEVKAYNHEHPPSNAYILPNIHGLGGSDGGYSMNQMQMRGPSAREEDFTTTPFLSRVPPPPASNATSYPHSIVPPSSVGGDVPPIPEHNVYGNPFTGGSGSDVSPTFARQQGQGAPSSGSSGDQGSSVGSNSVVAAAYAAAARGEKSSYVSPRSEIGASIANQRYSETSAVSLQQRLYVPGREQDMGPVPSHIEEEGSEAHTTETSPPDYHQATQPMHGRS